MSLRKQGKTGYHKERWTLEQVKIGLENFKKEFGHYPTSLEIDSYKYLPSSRSIQRSFGGLLNTRREIGLTGDLLDFRSGEHSSNRAYKIGKRSIQTENEIYQYLKNMFGIEFVHREFMFNDDGRTRTDFFVYCKNDNFSVDVFYPANIRNLIGCLNSKMRTYRNKEMLQYPVIFLQMNEGILKEQINLVLARKKNKLSENQQVMTVEEFKIFCKNKTPLSVSG